MAGDNVVQDDLERPGCGQAHKDRHQRCRQDDREGPGKGGAGHEAVAAQQASPVSRLWVSRTVAAVDARARHDRCSPLVSRPTRSLLPQGVMAISALFRTKVDTAPRSGSAGEGSHGRRTAIPASEFFVVASPAPPHRRGGPLEKFKPSIDWGNQLVVSSWWVLEASAISAACVLAIAILLIRYTTWATGFWRVTGDYFTGRASLPVWTVLAVLLLSVILEVRHLPCCSATTATTCTRLFRWRSRVRVRKTRRSAIREYTASGCAIVIFCILAAIRISRLLFDTYLTQRFIIRWRMWLTDRLTEDWLTGRAYYRARFTEPTIDNPDQRIQQDIDVFTTGIGTGPNVPTYYSQSMLLFGAVNAVASVASFTVILWQLSGPLTLFGVADPQGAVLDRHRLRADRVGDRISDRSSADPVELSQRADKRRVSLRDGAVARLRGGGRLLPRRASRARATQYEVCPPSSPTIGATSDGRSA